MQGLYQKVEWRRVEFISHAHQKSAENTFPRLGRLENSGKWLSQHWENKKSAKNGFPNIGKNEKQRKTAFPRLGRTKNSEKRLSQTWEERKTLKAEFPTPWKPKNAENHSSLVSEMQKTRKTGYCPRAICRKREKQAVAKKTEPRKSFI